ncbi:MAG TPA: zinc-binding alcohol dehydrogenase [Candidatus Saccharimonadales bacterium]|nr:zinc-binding alcohol dehydrogenase [Candidatus Saccharimonadales bacterium]
MKRVFALGGQIVVRDVPEPLLRPGHVLVQTAYSAISAGTESYILRLTADPHGENHEYPDPTSPGVQYRDPAVPYRGPEPLVMNDGPAASVGYSNAGIVLAVSPEVADLRPGDRVACSGSQCAVHAEICSVPRNLIAPVPENVRLDQASFVTLGSISMEALRRTRTTFGEFVVVYGLGLLGLLATQMAVHAGLRVIGLDTNPERLEQARAYGAEVVANPAREDAVAAVKRVTRGFGADGVILGIVDESSEPLNVSFEMSRHKGVVVGLGLFGMDIGRSRMFEHDVTFVGSKAYGPGRYDPVYEEGNVDFPIGFVRWSENRNAQEFLREISIGAVEVDTLAPIKVPIADAPRAYELLRSPGRPPTVVFDYGRG